MTFSKPSLLAVLLGALSVKGYFLQNMGYIGSRRADPIVDPGNPAANHTHLITGSSKFSDSVTSDILRSGKCTSVPIAQDFSNYWVPQLYFQWKNGSFSSVSGSMVVYYLFDQGVNVTAFPDNFRMITGTQTARDYDPTDPASLAVTFMCLDFQGTSTTWTHLPTEITCPDGYRAQINFPSCWDGVNLDSPDHKSHVAYRSGGPDSGDCNDPAFPVNMPRIFAEVYWGTNSFIDVFDEAMYSAQPFVFAQGDGNGYGYHADFYNGWEHGFLQNVLDKCGCTVAGFGDPTCCGDLGVVDYRPTVPSCSLEDAGTEQVLGLLPELPGGNQRTGLIPTKAGNIYTNGTWDLLLPLNQQPPSGLGGAVGSVAPVPSPSSSAAATPVTSSVKATSTASTVKAPSTSAAVPPSSSSIVKAPNSTPVPKPSSTLSSSSAKPTATSVAASSASGSSSGSTNGNNNNNNNDNWSAGGSSSGSNSNSGSATSSTGSTPSGSNGGSQSSSSNSAGSSSSNSNSNSNSGSGSGSVSSQAPAVQNTPASSASAWATSVATQAAQASATSVSSSQGTAASSSSSSQNGNGNGGVSSSSSQGGNGNGGVSSSSSSGSGSGSSSSSSQNSNAGSSGNGNVPVAAPAQNPPSSGSSGSAGSTSSTNTSNTGSSRNADKCKNRHASSLEARAASVAIKHSAINSHQHRSRSFIRMRNAGDMQV